MEAFERRSSSSSTTTELFSVIRRACNETEPQQVSGLFSTRCDLLQCSPAGFLAASAFRASNSCGSNNYLDQPEETGKGTAVVSSDPVVRLKPSPRCRVKSCGAELSKAKEYHRRHRVCEEHAKAPLVIVDALEQRFCQQCSRFQMVGEFDDTKRSCRRRLATHNERRRKSSQETVALIATVLEEHGQSLGAGNYFPQPANFDWMRCPDNNNVTKIWPDSPPLHLHSYHLDKSNEETFAFFSNPTGSSYSSPLCPNNYTSNTAQLAETVPGHVLSLLSPPPIDINHQTSFSKRAFNLNQSFYCPLPLATASSSATTTPACLIDNSARLGDAASSTTHHPPFSMTMPRGIMVWPPLT